MFNIQSTIDNRQSKQSIIVALSLAMMMGLASCNALPNIGEPDLAVKPMYCTMRVGLTRQLTTSEGSDGVTWAALDTLKATVDENGLVTARDTGVTYIRATRNRKDAICTVTIVPYN